LRELASVCWPCTSRIENGRTNTNTPVNSIYTNADPALLKLFEQAGSLRHVLCTPLDFAKHSHRALFCNGLGDVLKKAFPVPNSASGVDKLVAELTATCRHRGIALKHAFFGGEDTPSYAANFTAQLRRRGFLVARVNAFDAKKQRENLQASTDRLDLHGIAHCLLKGRARVLAKSPGLHHQLRLLVREREFLVRSLTRLKNRLHPHVDRLFPGFFNARLSGIEPAGPACWWLLEHRFSAPQIARRSQDTLLRALEQHRVPHAAAVAEQLRSLAAEALPPEPELVPTSQLCVEHLVAVARALQQAIGAHRGPTAGPESGRPPDHRAGIGPHLERRSGRRALPAPAVALTGRALFLRGHHPRHPAERRSRQMRPIPRHLPTL
jgi:transposase